jgi:hypothetical protein
MRKALALGLIALISACGGITAYEWRYARIIGPDGTRNWFALECEDMYDCYKHAGDACRGPYEIANGAAQESTEGHAIVSSTGNVGVARSESKKHSGGAMLIHCAHALAETP